MAEKLAELPGAADGPVTAADGWHELAVANPTFLLERLGSECTDLQGLRELFPGTGGCASLGADRVEPRSASSTGMARCTYGLDKPRRDPILIPARSPPGLYEREYSGRSPILPMGPAPATAAAIKQQFGARPAKWLFASQSSTAASLTAKVLHKPARLQQAPRARPAASARDC
jgi:hypothetical protein